MHCWVKFESLITEPRMIRSIWYQLNLKHSLIDSSVLFELYYDF